jgi:hypothetical protein
VVEPPPADPPDPLDPGDLDPGDPDPDPSAPPEPELWFDVPPGFVPSSPPLETAGALALLHPAAIARLHAAAVLHLMTCPTYWRSAPAAATSLETVC